MDSSETGRVEDPDGLLQLRKSNSVVARVSMFAQLEEDMKKASREVKAAKLPERTSHRSAARRDRGSQLLSRFATQPVTVGEVKEAVRGATSVTGAFSKLLIIRITGFIYLPIVRYS
jgi:hypothetical protein